MIPQKMLSQTEIDIEDINLYDVHDIEVIIKQDSFYLEVKDPAITDAHKMLIGISADKAALLNYKKPVTLQALWTDSNGIPGHTDVSYTTVDQIIKEGVYGN